MADIVGSLFGLSVPELQEQRRQRMMDENQQSAMMQARGSVAPGMTYNQAMLGRSLGQAIGGALFGVKDPMIERATQLEGILKQTQDELGADAQDPVKLYGTLSRNLGQVPELSREAGKALQLYQEAGKSQLQNNKAALENKQKEAVIAREESLRTELAALPDTASDDDYLKVARKFGAASDIMKAIERKQLANEGRELKNQEFNQKLAQDLQVAQEKNATTLQAAALNGANRIQLETLKTQGDLQIQAMKIQGDIQAAQSKAALDALKAGLPKDVAEANAALTGIDLTLNETAKWKSKLESGEIVFNPKENAIAYGSRLSGFPTKNALGQNEIIRTVKEGVNNLLLQAKGTQTEGDAKRANDLYVSAVDSNSNDSWKAALTALEKAQQKLSAEKKTYINTRGFSDRLPSSNANNDPLGLRK
jgi:hypothetical protein